MQITHNAVNARPRMTENNKVLNVPKEYVSIGKSLDRPPSFYVPLLSICLFTLLVIILCTINMGDQF